jgi:riboflavin kinase/FMN adenylyltransferase
MLANWCRANRIDLDPAEPVSWDGEPVSSSRIREAIHAGALNSAAAMLGRPYQLFGYVEEGRQMGTELGFPTLNLATEDECLPPFGVYAGHCLLGDGDRIPCVMNIGLRPTVGDRDASKPLVEAHLLDFNEDLYGSEIVLEPQKFLRPEQKFASLPMLRAAIARDVETARDFLTPPA